MGFAAARLESEMKTTLSVPSCKFWPGILGRRAWRSGRPGGLDARRVFHHGLLLALCTVVVQAQEPGRKKVPDDSVEVSARGCFKGRVFTGSGRTEDESVTLGPDITGKSFRVAAKRPVMDEVKKHDGHWVAIEGIIRKADLEQAMLGARVGNSRVVIGMPGRNDPSRVNMAAPPSVPVMDLTSVRFLDASCPIR
jgi:hypothetical protein